MLTAGATSSQTKNTNQNADVKILGNFYLAEFSSHMWKIAFTRGYGLSEESICEKQFVSC